MAQLFNTNKKNVSALVLRLTLGGVMLPHGAQKLLGMFGGKGFEATIESMTTQGDLPIVIAFLVIMGESLGALSLIFGFATRFVALSIGIIMTGAMLRHTDYFFMNWLGNQSGEGIEYHLLAIGIALALVISGGGALSTDAYLSQGGKKRSSPYQL